MFIASTPAQILVMYKLYCRMGVIDVNTVLYK